MKTGLLMNWPRIANKGGLPEGRSLIVDLWSPILTLALNRLLGIVGVFILCVNLWRYFHLMWSPFFTLWGHVQSKPLFLQSRHSHVMRKPTKMMNLVGGPMR